MTYFGGTSRLAGDPGLFDVLKKIGRTALGIATFSPARAIGSLFSRPQQNIPGAPARIPRVLEGPFDTGLPPEAFTGRANGISKAMAGISCPSGFHPAKDGSGRCVRNRRRNPYNRKAAKRAAGRLKALGVGLKSVKKSVKAADKALN